MPILRDTAFFTLAPDWACEVISPRSGRLDRARKMPIYEPEGVRHLWIVDPLARTLEVYRLEDGRWIVAATHGGDEVVRVEPFAMLELALEHWWLESTDPAG